jgi:hypothetical protein
VDHQTAKWPHRPVGGLIFGGLNFWRKNRMSRLLLTWPTRRGIVFASGEGESDVGSVAQLTQIPPLRSRECCAALPDASGVLGGPI